MILPKISAYESQETQLTVFGGLNRRDKISDSDFSEMQNMSSRAVPAIAVRRSRKNIAAAKNAVTLAVPEYTGGLSSFTGIKDNHFYYNGELISGDLTDGKKSVADFNGKICIFPDKVYYDYIPSEDTGTVSSSLTSMEKSVTVSNAYFYSSYDDLTGEYTAYISASDAEFDSVFTAGDSICISGCSYSQNNTKSIQSRRDYAAETDIVSAVAEEVSSIKIELLLYNKKGEKVQFHTGSESETVTLKKFVPDMNHICVHNNRLWGTSASGEYIYASKLGDCTDFNSFQGLSDDSWYSYIGTGGEFTGICSYRTAVVAFKRNCIHHVYGDSPTNFSIPKHTYGGCIDGRSVCEIGGVLYYLSNDGFYGYSGGEPYRISTRFEAKYSSCAAGTDGKVYYASAADEDNCCEVLVYDPETDIWVKEDETRFEDFCSCDGNIYGIADDALWQLDCQCDEDFSWSVTTKRFTYNTMLHKGLSCIRIRADISDNTDTDVYISFDNNGFKNCGSINGKTKNGFSVWRIPVRFEKCDSFRIKLQGRGDAVIHDIEITSYNGGKNHG